jgi:hypothetical protein
MIDIELSITTNTTNHASVNRANLNKYRYTVSLIQEGFRIGLVDGQTMSRIQIEIAAILKDLIVRYTKWESSSVRIETAEMLMNSIYYAIDAYTSSFNDPEKTIACLKTESIVKIYEKGLQLVIFCVADTKMLYREIKRNKLDIPLEVYNTSIDKALPGFFTDYSAVFNAHDTTCTLDYPLVFDDMNRQGVYYMRNYLENLAIETAFCRLFDTEDIVKVLANYGRIYRIDYQKAPINIFEILINNAIFAVLSGNHGSQLDISLSQVEVVKSRFNNREISEIDLFVDEAFEKVIGDLKISQPKLLNYLRRYKVLFYPRLVNAIENKSLLNLIITGIDEQPEVGGITFQTGIKMDDNSFSMIIESITVQTNVSEKIDLIISNVHSVADFIDMLQADCLYGDEIYQLFNAVGDMELAVLGKVVFFEELRDDYLKFSSPGLSNKKFEMEWQIKYFRFIQDLSKDRIEIIERLMNDVNERLFYAD